MQDAGRSDTGKVEEGTNFVGSLNGRIRKLGSERQSRKEEEIR